MTGKLFVVKENPALSIPELAEKLGKSERTIERTIQELRLYGLLKRIGPAKGGEHREMSEIIDLEAKGEVAPPSEIIQKQQKMTGKIARFRKMTGKILLLLQDNPALSIPELAEKIGKVRKDDRTSHSRTAAVRAVKTCRSGQRRVLGSGEDGERVRGQDVKKRD